MREATIMGDGGLARAAIALESVAMSDVDTAADFDEMARALQRPILRYLERYVGDRAQAEDLWQETLIRLHRGRATFAGRSSLQTWAFSIAHRVAIDHFREPAQKVRRVELDEAGEWLDALPDTQPEVGERMVIDEMNACVRQVIDGLPVAYREALILHDLEGLSAEQTAEICECTLATAKIRIHRARQRLKQALATQCAFYRGTDNELRCDRKARNA